MASADGGSVQGRPVVEEPNLAESWTTVTGAKIPTHQKGPAESWTLGCIVITIIFVTLGYTGYEAHPRVLGLDATPEVFSGARAHANVRELSDGIGVRVFGSKENEEAGEWIWTRAQALKTIGESNGKSIEIDRSRSSGCNVGNRKGVRTALVYFDVENIAVKVCGTEDCSTGPFVLVSAHFDSAANSPGGSDAGGMVGVMLEMLSNLVHRKAKLRRPVVFLFNGGEEPFLLASHAFVSHPWWKHIGVFINLEASGTGGAPLLFQTGPEAWLGGPLQRSLRYPHAHAAAQDVFEFGAVPSTTDFSIYTGYGNVSGYDFANVRNGQAYHTVLDTASRCTDTFLQHMGDNALDLLCELAGDRDPVAAMANRDSKSGKLVYFDVLGQVLIQYQQHVGYILYTCILLLLLRTLSARHTQVPRVARATAALGLGLVSALGSSALLGLTMARIGAPMMWYGRILMAPALYGALPTIIFLLVFHAIAGPLSSDLAYASASVLYGLIMVAFVALGLRMAYLPALYMLGTVLASMVKVKGGTGEAVRFAFALLPQAILGLPTCFASLEVFTATMGRVGHSIRSDMLIGVLCGFLTGIHLGPLLSCMTVSAPRFLRAITVSAIGMFVGAVFFSMSLEVPYTAESPKRVVMNDVTFADDAKRSGVYMQCADAILLEDLPVFPKDRFPEAPSLVNNTWGVYEATVFDSWAPHPATGQTPASYIPAKSTGMSSTLPPAELEKLADETDESRGIRSVKIRLHAPKAELVSIRLPSSLTRWSMDCAIPRTKDNSVIVRLNFGHGSRPWEVTLEFSELKEDLELDVTSVAYKPSAVLENLSQKLPEWGTMMSHVTNVRSFVL